MLSDKQHGKFLRFTSGIGERLVDAGDIVEVIPMIALQRDSDDDENPRFCGVFDYRGHIVPVFDLQPYRDKNIQNPDIFLVIVYGKASLLALVAYDIDDLVEVEADNINEVRPESGTPFRVAKIQENLIKVVNPDRFAG